jgi:protein O-GlcNAc transferase
MPSTEKMAGRQLRCVAALALLSLRTANGNVAAAADWKASLQKAVGLHQQGDLAGSSPFYRAALDGNPSLRSNWAVLTNFALSVQPDAPAEAAEAFEAVVAMTPDSADAYYNLGRARADAGDHAGAEAALRSCLRLNPEDADAYYDLAIAHLRQPGEASAEAAVAAARASIALSPEDGKAWVTLGDGLAAKQEWAQSREAYAKACALRPEHMPSWSSLGNAHDECGDVDHAEASWKTALSLGGDHGSHTVHALPRHSAPSFH